MWLLMGVLLIIPFAAAKLDRDCFVNWTQVACGLENWPPNDSFCNDIELNVMECYNDGSDFYATFSGIDNFTIKELYKGLTFDIYSRTKVWRGSIAITSPEAGFDVLPEGAVISKTDNKYLFYAPIGNYSITGFQVTVPYCYKIEDEGEKVYLKTQAGKSCYTKSREAEIVPEEAPQPEEVAQPEAKKYDFKLLLIVILIIIIAVLLFRPRKKLKKEKK